MSKKKQNKEKQAVLIRKKYLLENKHISVGYTHSFYYTRVNIKKKRIYISDTSPNTEDSMNEITTPAALDNYLGQLKRNEAILYDLDSNQEFTWEEHYNSRMILRLAGVE